MTLASRWSRCCALDRIDPVIIGHTCLLLDLVERLLERWPPVYLTRLKAREQRKQQELDTIRERITAMQAKIPRPPEA